MSSTIRSFNCTSALPGEICGRTGPAVSDLARCPERVTFISGSYNAKDLFMGMACEIPIGKVEECCPRRVEAREADAASGCALYCHNVHSAHVEIVVICCCWYLHLLNWCIAKDLAIPPSVFGRQPWAFTRPLHGFSAVIS